MSDELGTLVVVVLKARNLIDKHFFKQDVYCQLALNGEEQKTRTDVKGGQHPVWDDEKRFKVFKDSETKFRSLKVQCFSKEHRKSDDDLGSGDVDISDTLKSGEFDDWVPLSLNGQHRGEVYLEMTFFSNAPAPAPAPSPAPSSKPATPKPSTLGVQANLARRPSKWKPSERLARPDQTQYYAQMRHQVELQPGLQGQQYPPGSHNHARSSSEGRSPSALPIPGSLAAGRPKPQDNISPSSPPQQQLPSFLRPNRGGPPNRPVSQHSPTYPDANIPNPYTTPTPNPYLNTSHSHGEMTPNSYTPAPGGSMYGPEEHSTSVNVSFPTPDIPSVIPRSQSAHPRSPTSSGYPPIPQPPVQPSGFPPSYPPPVSPPPPPATNLPPPPPSLPNVSPPSISSVPPPSILNVPPPPIPNVPTSPAPNVAPPPQASAMTTAPHPPNLASSPEPPVPGRYPGRKSPEREKSLPDPYLQARYMAPLPLPPGAEREAAEREAKRKAEEERLRKEAEERARQEEERRKEEEAQRKREEEERQRKAEEERLRREEEERKRREEEERRKREEEERKKREEEERRRREEEERRRREEEERQRQEEERRQREERERLERIRKAEEEARRRKEQAERDRAFAEQIRREEQAREEEERARREADEAFIAKLEQERLEEEERERAERKAQAEADEELARRLAEEARQQEDQDMEFAKRLDRELNLRQ